MTKPTYTISQIADPKFYRANRADILEAMQEPGRPSIDDDVRREQAKQQETEIAALNVYQPQKPLSFRRSDIARMSAEEYKRLQPAIMAAQRGEGGAKIIPDLPTLQTAKGIRPVTIYESEKAYIESGGEALQRQQSRKQLSY